MHRHGRRRPGHGLEKLCLWSCERFHPPSFAVITSCCVQLVNAFSNVVICAHFSVPFLNQSSDAGDYRSGPRASAAPRCAACTSMKKCTISSYRNSSRRTALFPSATLSLPARSWDRCTMPQLSRCLWTRSRLQRPRAARWQRRARPKHAVTQQNRFFVARRCCTAAPPGSKAPTFRQRDTLCSPPSLPSSTARPSSSTRRLCLASTS